MKILHVCEYATGGVATYVRELLDYQKKENDVYLVLASNFSEKVMNIDRRKIKFYKYRRNPLYFLYAIITIYNFIRHVQPDIVHVHSTFAGFFIRFPLFFLRKKSKIIYCSHGWAFLMDIPKWKKKVFAFIEKILAHKTDLIINISNYEYQESLKYGLPAKKSVTILNGVRSRLIEKNMDIEFCSNKINLLFVGRFDKQKGIDILLNMFKKFNFSNLHLFTIGEKVLNQENIDTNIDNVTNIGWVNNGNIDAYYDFCDVVIVPSRWEGFGLVAAEAMRNKKALIVSNRGSLPELVKDGYNGFVFNVENSGELLGILEKINKRDLKKMGEKGYEFYQKYLTSNLMNEKIIKEYKKILRGKKL